MCTTEGIKEMEILVNAVKANYPGERRFLLDHRKTIFPSHPQRGEHGSVFSVFL